MFVTWNLVLGYFINMDDNDDKQNKNNTEEAVVVPEDELAHQALTDTAGNEAIEAEELQGDSAPVTNEAATGEVEDTNINDRDVVTQDLQEEADKTPGAEKPSSDVAPEAIAESGVADEIPGETKVDLEMLEDESPKTAKPDGIEAASEVVGVEPPAGSEGEAAVMRDDSNDNPNARWYVVHTYSGHENKVATNLMQKVASEHLEAFILDVLVPTQDKIEIRSGKKETVKEKIFPGYILVKMVLDDIAWLAVRTTPGVTSFVGMGNKPTPIPEAEVKTIVKFMTQGAAPTFKDVYSIGDTVKIAEGPFAQFIGKVDSVDKDRGKVRVLVSIFGRETPVELDFLQVQKL